ncbi:MAG: hypothetical protein AAF487_08025 [Bacteroidota bacterium]
MMCSSSVLKRIYFLFFLCSFHFSYYPQEFFENEDLFPCLREFSEVEREAFKKHNVKVIEASSVNHLSIVRYEFNRASQLVRISELNRKEQVISQEEITYDTLGRLIHSVLRDRSAEWSNWYKYDQENTLIELKGKSKFCSNLEKEKNCFIDAYNYAMFLDSEVNGINLLRDTISNSIHYFNKQNEWLGRRKNDFDRDTVIYSNRSDTLLKSWFGTNLYLRSKFHKSIDPSDSLYLLKEKRITNAYTETSGPNMFGGYSIQSSTQLIGSKIRISTSSYGYGQKVESIHYYNHNGLRIKSQHIYPKYSKKSKRLLPVEMTMSELNYSYSYW